MKAKNYFIEKSFTEVISNNIEPVQRGLSAHNGNSRIATVQIFIFKISS